MILFDLKLQMIRDNNRLNSGHYDGTFHRKMSVVGMAGDHGDNQLKFCNHVIV